MTKFTDIFIRRPVLSIVVSLLIFIIGLNALQKMQLRQYPEISSTMIAINTVYPGAPAKLVEGFITSVIEKSVASAEGIDYMNSNSIDGLSTINIFAKLNFDPTTIFTDVMSKVSAVENQLPTGSQLPVITKSTGGQASLMYVGFNSTAMSEEQITDYITRVVQPKLETVFGVADVEILGDKVFAMRIWLNRNKMAAYNVTPSDVASVLSANNYQAAAGNTNGDFVQYDITAKTDAQNASTFEDLVVKNVNGVLVRMRDIARVELGSQDYDSSVVFNGEKAVFIAIDATPTANPLQVIGDVKKMLPELKKLYPPGLDSKVVYDATVYISASIKDVIKTIFEAAIIVILVIFLFLGSIRTVMIPVVTIPLSLVGMCGLMYSLGYSMNMLTLLAMVLAIGMVVDDAIVVVENVYRHIEEGMLPFNAAVRGAREIALPVISMTITLAAVYAPIGFMTGLTGALFKEFAFSLAGSVVISGIIALTLSPMMCSKILTAELQQDRFVNYVDHQFERLKTWYASHLHGVLGYRNIVVFFAVVVFSSCIFLYLSTKSELSPEEDQGVVFVNATAPEYANLNYVEQYTQPFNSMYKSFPSMEDYFIINGFQKINSVMSAIILKPWDQRKQSQKEVQTLLQQKLNNDAGLMSVAFPLASLPGAGNGLPVQFVLTSTESFEQLFTVADQIANDAKTSGLFLYVNNSLKINRPQLIAQIDRGKAGDLGISMQDIGNTLSYTLGGNYINYFSMEGKSYEVIPELQRRFRLNPEDIRNIYMKTTSGDMVPLSTMISLNIEAQPNIYTHFQQLNSATIQAVLIPSKTMGEALAFLKESAAKHLRSGMTYDYAGELRQYIQEGNSLLYAFFLSIIVIYLVLAAQFESFRDPLIILISVPMSICGALIPLNLGAATINIYTQIGLITLIGLISKHGILMVEFANQLQQKEGLSIQAAIEKAAAIRLRPVLMTTAAMILGVVPLIIASGAGAASRFDIGIVIGCGMFVGTLFTLFVVPTMYTLIAKKHQPLPEVED